VKKALFVFIIVAVALSFVACPKSGGGSGGLPGIGVAIYKFDDTFMSYTRNAIQANAAGKVYFLVPSGTQVTSQQPIAKIG